MSWLWFAGPLVFVLCLLAVSLWPTTEERRLRAALDRWVDGFLAPLLNSKGKPKNRRVRTIPSVFSELVEEVGGGTRVADIVLVPKEAYLVARAADAMTSTNQITVLFKLEEPAPSFTCKPVPIVDGRPADNKGLLFKKDPYFGEAFWVEGPKEVLKWLRKGIRRRLMESPEAWLRVRGKTAALTLYGGVDEAALDALVDAADEIFAAYGTDSEVSLFGELEHEPEGYRGTVKKSKKGAGSKGRILEVEAAPASFKTRVMAGAVDVGLYVLAAFAVALTSGELAAFHNASFGSIFFNSPDINPTEPWQGGWTTKGFGIFVAAECLLACLFVIQSYWVSVHGQTFGKRLFGARVERDGEPPGFLRGIVMRGWIFALLPLGVAAATAVRPLTAASFFTAIPSRTVMAAAGVLVLVGAASLQMAASDGKSLRDRIAGTRVVQVEPLRLPHVQLGMKGTDPIAMRRLYVFAGIFLAFITVNIIASVADVSFWIY